MLCVFPCSLLPSRLTTLATSLLLNDLFQDFCWGIIIIATSSNPGARLLAITAKSLAHLRSKHFTEMCWLLFFILSFIYSGLLHSRETMDRQ